MAHENSTVKTAIVTAALMAMLGIGIFAPDKVLSVIDLARTAVTGEAPPPPVTAKAPEGVESVSVPVPADVSQEATAEVQIMPPNVGTGEVDVFGRPLDAASPAASGVNQDSSVS